MTGYREADTAGTSSASPAPQHLPAPTRLTRSERAMIPLIAQGLSDKAIAKRLVLSHYTVRTYMKELYSKLGVHRRAEVVAKAFADALQETSAGQSDH